QLVGGARAGVPGVGTENPRTIADDLSVLVGQLVQLLLRHAYFLVARSNLGRVRRPSVLARPRRSRSVFHRGSWLSPRGPPRARAHGRGAYASSGLPPCSTS